MNPKERPQRGARRAEGRGEGWRAVDGGGSAGGGEGIETTLGKGGDEAIIALVVRAVHEPFDRVWRERRRRVWREGRSALKRAASAHASALAELEGRSREEPTKGGEGARTRYCRTIADGLAPLCKALAVCGAGERFEAALAAAAREAENLIADLPDGIPAPLAPNALDLARSGSLLTGTKAALAGILPPPMRPRPARKAPVRDVARRQLVRVLLPHQRNAFREVQSLRVAWLHDLERAWIEWTAAVFAQGPDKEILEAGDRLQRSLTDLIARTPESVERSPGERLDACMEVLRAETAVAGTWVGRRAVGRGCWHRMTAEAHGWDRRAEESAASLAVCLELLRTRVTVEGASCMLVGLWQAEAAEVVQRLEEVRSHLVVAGERVLEAQDLSDGSPDGFDRQRVEVVDDLNKVEAALAEPAHARKVFADATEAALETIEGVCGALPEALTVHSLPSSDSRVRIPRRRGRPVHLRAAARMAFGPLRRHRLRAASAIVPRSMPRVLAAVAELREIAAYGYEAAAQEAAGGKTSGAGPAPLATMIGDGLARAAEAVGRAREIVDEALDEAMAGAKRELSGGVQLLLRRVTAKPLAARLLDLRAAMAVRSMRGRERRRSRAQGAVRRATAVATEARRRVRPVRGVLGIGEDGASRAAFQRPPLAETESVTATLPALYRRLFSFDPVTDARLLAGREDALAAVAATCERWRGERYGSMMVVARPGVGVTSFLNIAAQSLGGALPSGISEVVRERCREEAPLAALLSEWLGVAAAPDLDELAATVLAAADESLPRFVILEGMEQLQLRVAGEGHLFERTVDFTVRTSSRIFWVLSMTASAWQLACKRSSSSISDLEQVRLGELSVDELRRAILERHRLSGIPLLYHKPSTGRQAVLRRLRTLREPEWNRRQVESDYFRRLHRASMGSMRAALLNWLRSADFRTVEGSLLVRPVVAPTVSLDGLDTLQRFALKALLDHGTLTIAEYREIARLTEPDARHRFRALQEFGLIEPVPEGEGVGDGARGTGMRVREQFPAKAGLGGRERYHIHPFMVGVVATHLKSANILH